MVRYFYIAFLFYVPILAIFIPATNFGSGIPDINIERIFFYLLGLVFIFEISITKARIITFSKWLFIPCVFCLIVLGSVRRSNYSYDLTTMQAISWKVFVPLVIAYVAHHLFSHKHNVDLYIKNICVGAAILSLIIILKMIFALVSGYTSFRSAAGGAFDNPNAVAIFLVLTIPCIIYGIESKIIPIVLGRIVTFSVVVGIICTISRKGFVTMVVAFLIYFVLRKQFKRLIVLGILCTVFAPILIGYTGYSNRFSEEMIEEQLEGKKNMALAGWDMFKRSPLLGHGYKGYHRLFSEYFPVSRFRRYDAHNMYITALANYGIVGFIPFMGIFLYPLYFSAKTLRNRRTDSSTSYSKHMAIICISSLVPFMISGYFAGGLFYAPHTLGVLYSQITFLFTSSVHENERLTQ